MIVLYHQQQKISEVFSTIGQDFSAYHNQKITQALLAIAAAFPDEILLWCEQGQKDNLNWAVIDEIFHHRKLMFSYARSSGAYLGRHLGYVELKPYANINKKVHYGTWQMSSQVGAIHASVLSAVKDQLNPKDTFDYFLNSLAKRAMAHGLLCYSEPALLHDRSLQTDIPRANYYELFQFVKQHYKMRWVFLLFFNLLYFEKKFLLAPFLYSFLFSRRSFDPAQLHQIIPESKRNIQELNTIDVLIPTIGRKQYLFDVLKILAQQTHLPKNVIVIEQNPDPQSVSELDYLNEEWPFKIKHQFTHQAGACNARNLGLQMIESEFCFMADDDLIFDAHLIKSVMQSFETIGNEVLLVACHLKGQQVEVEPPKQFPFFGSGVAFVKSACLKNLSFRMGFEFGFGEDVDFGMQLRNNGYDVLYLSTIKILHLKAPMGGFRIKPVLRWQHEVIAPKPSPTIMLYQMLHQSAEQINSYKVTLFISTFGKSFLINPWSKIQSFRKKWNVSQFWAQQLMND